MKKTEKTNPTIIPEGEGRFPWWVWIPVLVWMIYAIFIAPFDLTSPGQ